MKMPDLEPAPSLDFIRERVAEDVKANKNGGRVHTRFPPEPNGYLHIGHAKSICLNFGVAAEYNGLCNLRFDDTNPSKETVEFEDATHVLRAKIDMASPNINMRDPVIFRSMNVPHYRQGSKWVIYPMYDYAHPISDALEDITHSLCTLEFEDHRPLYDWCLEKLPVPSRPVQIEFARLNLSYTVLSKRKLLTLVTEGLVNGWDDPRMPTLSGLRRRGYTPEAIRNFCDSIGVAKRDAIVDVAQLEHAIRDDLNKRSQRVMAVLRPLRVVIENYPEGQGEELDAINNPEDASAGTRKVPFSRTLYVEQDDFRENPPKQFFRLAPGREVRLRYAYFITCKEVIKDAAGNVAELRCTYDPATRGGDSPDGRSPKATLHWVSAAHAVPAEARLYDRLFNEERPDNDSRINPSSLEVVGSCQVEPSLKSAKPGDRLQFERIGYFCVDLDSKPGALVFNRTVTLRDTWAKIEKSLKK